MPPRASKSPSRPSRTDKASEFTADELDAKLSKEREELGLFKTPFTVCRLFATATVDFLASNVLSFSTSPAALFVVYPLLGLLGMSVTFFPSWYARPENCDGSGGGWLYGPSLGVYESLWWLILGILSSIGLGTGLHSGIMFLWPFVMGVIINVQTCESTSFSATYTDPCVLKCSGSKDGSDTFIGTFLLLVPSIVLWGSGTAIGELPPYFITRAARRAGKRASDFETELTEARQGTDMISRLKMWTIDFTEKHGFVGILALASWPNAAFDMCGMACGWLMVPFWTFFGATLIGKGLIKVSLQTFVCILVFGKTFWEGILAFTPSVSVPQFMCAKAGVPSGASCTLNACLEGGRRKLMTSFTLQRRVLPKDFLDGAAALDKSALLNKYCGVMVAGEALCGTQGFSGAWANTAKYEEFSALVSRVLASPSKGGYDADADGQLNLAELELAAGLSDGKLSLGSLDPGSGSIFSLGTLWNGFIAGLICFFIYSIVEQVAINAQASIDAERVEALEASLRSRKPATSRTASPSPTAPRAKSPAHASSKKKAPPKKTPGSKRKKE